MNISYELTDNQQKEYDEWVGHCGAYAGAIGGRVSITFTPTSLGDCVEANCMCGEKLDLTEVDDW